MRKKMLLLTLSLVAAALPLAPRVEAGGTYSCPRCTTYSDGSRCCVSCICNSSGFPIACTDNYCPPEGGDN